MLRGALLVAIIVVASPARADEPHLSDGRKIGVLVPGFMLHVKCATPEERSATVQHLNSKIDWFLSRVEVPAAITKQLDKLGKEGVDNPAVLNTLFSHPWVSAHAFRDGAQRLKSQLASLLTETNRETRLKAAIMAYGDSAALANLLRKHARINPDKHITDLGTWNGEALALEDKFRRLATCLVDVPSEPPQKSESPR